MVPPRITPLFFRFLDMFSCAGPFPGAPPSFAMDEDDRIVFSPCDSFLPFSPPYAFPLFSSMTSLPVPVLVGQRVVLAHFFRLFLFFLSNLFLGRRDLLRPISLTLVPFFSPCLRSPPFLTTKVIFSSFSLRAFLSGSNGPPACRKLFCRRFLPPFSQIGARSSPGSVLSPLYCEPRFQCRRRPRSSCSRFFPLQEDLHLSFFLRFFFSSPLLASGSLFLTSVKWPFFLERDAILCHPFPRKKADRFVGILDLEVAPPGDATPSAGSTSHGLGFFSFPLFSPLLLYDCYAVFSLF